MRVAPAFYKRYNEVKLLREYFELCDGGICQDLLTEDEKRRVRDEGAIILSGVMQMSETQNGNGRIYPHKILEREVNNYMKMVDERRALGELDHPDTSVINLSNASHLVTKIWMEDNKCMGKIEVLNTPSGRVLKELVNAGCKLGISSRGMGSVTERNGVTMVEDDFQLICWDFVSEPSTPGAFMMKEGVEVRRNDLNKVFNKSDRIYRAFNDVISWGEEK